MIFNLISNIYNINQRTAWDAFSAHLSGSDSGLLLAISASPLGEAARKALDSSAKALGYGPGACAFASILSPTAPKAAEPPERDAAASLDASSLRLLVEGVDPLALVVADDAALKLVRQAYPDAAFSPPSMTGIQSGCSLGRAFGRTVTAFESFEKMLDSAESKQAAWALLKKLPHLD